MRFRSISAIGILYHFLTGCSTSPHPLVDDVTGMSSAAIMKKVRCETQSAIDGIYDDKKFAATDDGYKKFQGRYKEATARITKETEFIQSRLNSERGLSPKDREDLNKQQKYWTGRKKRLDKAARAWEAKWGPFMLQAIAYQLEFEITTNDDATVEGGFGWPIHFGTAKAGYAAHEKRKRYAMRTIRVSNTFSDILAFECPKRMLDENRHYPITGNTGIEEGIKQYFVLLGQGGLKAPNNTDPFSDEITFTTNRSASLKPEFSINPGNKARIIGAEFDFTKQRTDTHRLIFNLTPWVQREEQSPASPIKVEIVGPIALSQDAQPSGPRSIYGVPADGSSAPARAETPSKPIDFEAEAARQRARAIDGLMTREMLINQRELRDLIDR